MQEKSLLLEKDEAGAIDERQAQRATFVRTLDSPTRVTEALPASAAPERRATASATASANGSLVPGNLS
ncbi:hypothetical protein E4U21_000186 [Claviceps maximensis]|nr:hypothetical protein E4U21_000186 [Claviceps maximensis]